ncbi:uncharacterized protein LOC126903853 [Daktulosphaira vitifoliae]|uniref:uncharacterized protein LOC126903853 n=1 Tax=Daktulosphaira vitifoliae TaxID=58002 RepID=UPI0021AACB25|nr:uncharacterized protein LOC126903853 [Daktulosphaira vitifoliae]
MKSITVIIVLVAIVFVVADSANESLSPEKRSFSEEFSSSEIGPSVSSPSGLNSGHSLATTYESLYERNNGGNSLAVPSTVGVADDTSIIGVVSIPTTYSVSTPTSYAITAPVPLPTTGPLIQISKEVFVINRHAQPVSSPYPVPIQRNVAIPIPSPVPFPIDHPYAVRVAAPYHVPVEKPVPYNVNKPIPQPIAVPDPVPIIQNVLFPVFRPFPIPVVSRILVPVVTPIINQASQPTITSASVYNSSYPASSAIPSGYGPYTFYSGYGLDTSSYSSSSYSSYNPSISSLPHGSNYSPSLSSYGSLYSQPLSPDSSLYSSSTSYDSSKYGSCKWTPIYKHNTDDKYTCFLDRNSCSKDFLQRILNMKLLIITLLLCLCLTDCLCNNTNLKNEENSRNLKTAKQSTDHYYSEASSVSGVGTFGVPTIPFGSRDVRFDRPTFYPTSYESPVTYPVNYNRLEPYPTPFDRPLSYPITVDRLIPYPIHVEKPLPYPVQVDRPVPYPIHVEKPMPYPVHVDRPYPVTIDKPVPYPVHVPYKVSVPVDRPYPVHVPIPKPYPVDRPVPFAVQVPVQVPVVQQVPYEVSKPYPVVVTKPVMVPQPVLWEKPSLYPVYIDRTDPQTAAWGNSPNYIGVPVFSNRDYPYGSTSGYNIGVNHALTGLGANKNLSGGSQLSINNVASTLMGNAYNTMQGLISPGGSFSGYASGHNSYLGPKTSGFTANINK